MTGVHLEYRKPFERFARSNIVRNIDFGGGSTKHWTVISPEERTKFVAVSRRMTADWYIRNIIQGHLNPYAVFIRFERFI